MKKIPLFLLLAFVISGCSFSATTLDNKTEEKVESLGSDNEEIDEVNIDDRNITIKDDEHEATIGFGKLPEDFPSEIPLYEDGDPEVVVSVAGEDNGKSEWVLALEYADAPDDLANIYLEMFKNKGWEIKNQSIFTFDGSSQGGFQASNSNYQVDFVIAESTANFSVSEK